jgi:4-hydroxyphenylpyruvate dioxygenase
MGSGAGEAVIQTKEKLVGAAHFKRVNPMSDRFDVKKFHHIEFYCGDGNNTYRRFSAGLGMKVVAKSDNSTGNNAYASYVLKSGELNFTFTAPYQVQSADGEERKDAPGVPHPAFDQEHAFQFFKAHGLAVKAVGILVGDAEQAYNAAVANGAVGKVSPQTLKPSQEGEPQGEMKLAEVLLYGETSEVHLRFISGDYQGHFLPGYAPVESADISFGLKRLDHCVGNVPDMLKAYNYLVNVTGFHEFAEFTAEDVGTIDSGLNSIVAASNNEMVLFPINEPTFGTKRKSQIQTYLDQYVGAGVQHLALKTENIFNTLRHMRKAEMLVGFELMPRPSEKYYRELKIKVGDSLTDEQYKTCEELGILVDKDDQGVLLQVFTRPVGDRPTLFIEIIERVGCMREVKKKEKVQMEQAAGCGGFGKGNFKELFKSVEEYEATLDV